MALKDILSNPDVVKSILGRKQSTAVTFNNQRTFEYSAASASGARHKGKMQANSAAAVSAALQADGWLPLSVSEASNVGMNMDLTALLGRSEKTVKLSVGEAAAFFRQAAELLRAGVAMIYILQALGAEASPKIRKICDGLAEGLNAGVPLSEAMLAFPDAFDKVTRAYIAAGEAAGRLPETMARLAVSTEKKNDLRLKIKAVTAYPKMVSYAIGGIVFAILKFMVPMYEDIYASFQSGLPAPTRVLVAISKNLTPIGFNSTFPYPFFISDEVEWGPIGVVGRVFFMLFFIVGLESLRNRRGKDPKRSRAIMTWAFLAFVTVFAGGYYFIPAAAVAWGSIGGLVLGIKAFIASGDKSLERARLVDKIRFRLPVFGGIARLNALFQWATTLGGALASGVPLTRALVLAGETAGSRWHSSVAEPLQAAVMAGRPLSEALADYSDLYPATLRAMVTTGEVTGDLPTMFANVAHSAEVEVEVLIAGLSAKVEVVLLVVMGIVVGGLLVSLYLPIINLATAASG